MPTASLTAKGITQLSSATNSTSEVLAPHRKLSRLHMTWLTGSIQPRMQPRHKKG
ncbi:phage tail protein [Escherichia coli]|uniref:phage tail protein n=1 Tax=Escherichia coli TaxID=562 RepID=UPI003D9CACE1